MGARAGGGKAGIEANVFRILTKDEIGFNNVAYSNENLDPAEHQGINLSARLALGDLASLRLGYAYRVAHFRSGTYNGNDVPEIPRNSATLGVVMRVTSRQEIGVDGVYTGKRYFGDDFANDGKMMDGHTRWNAHYHYAPATWKLGLAVDNLTNEKVADIGYYNPFATNPYYYYPLPERAVRVTAEKTF
jgi:iron complex outermembrane receptor protein